MLIGSRDSIFFSLCVPGISEVERGLGGGTVWPNETRSKIQLRTRLTEVTWLGDTDITLGGFIHSIKPQGPKTGLSHKQPTYFGDYGSLDCVYPNKVVLYDFLDNSISIS